MGTVESFLRSLKVPMLAMLLHEHIGDTSTPFGGRCALIIVAYVGGGHAKEICFPKKSDNGISRVDLIF